MGARCRLDAQQRSRAEEASGSSVADHVADRHGEMLDGELRGFPSVTIVPPPCANARRAATPSSPSPPRCCGITFGPCRPRTRSAPGMSGTTEDVELSRERRGLHLSARTRVYGRSCCSNTHRVHPASGFPPHGSYTATRGSRKGSRCSAGTNCVVASTSRASSSDSA